MIIDMPGQYQLSEKALEEKKRGWEINHESRAAAQDLYFDHVGIGL